MDERGVLVGFASRPEGNLPPLVTSYPDAVRKRAFKSSGCYAVILVLANPAPSEVPPCRLNYLIGEADNYLVEVLPIPAFSLAFLQ